MPEGKRTEAGDQGDGHAAVSRNEESAPEIPWTDIAGLRDLIAHEYFRIDIHRVLEIVERDLPPLEQAIDGLLDNLREPSPPEIST